MTRARLEQLIPHRGTMLLLDELVELDQDRIVCRKTFRDDEFFFQGHYPDYPLVPGVILCECAMQAGAALLAHQLQQLDGVPVATRLNQVRFRRMVRPGDTVEVQTTLKERVSQAFYLSAQVRCDGQVAARLDFACTLAPPPAEPPAEP